MQKMYNDSILELIRTFTPSEKSNFKRYISFTGGERNLKYEELYNIYNSYLNKGYDKATFDIKLVAAIKKKPHLYKNLNNIRKRLKDKLLESLAIQNNSSNKVFEITKGINEVYILIERRLFQVASQRIKQLKDKAIAFNLNKYVVELIKLEIAFLEVSSTKNDETDLQNLITEQEHYLHLYETELTLENILHHMTLLISKDLKLNKTEHISKFHQLHSKIESISIETYEQSKQVFIVLWYYRIKNIYYRFTNKASLAYEYSKKLMSYFDQDELLIKNFQKEYVKAICSHSRTCFLLNKVTELDDILGKAQHYFRNQKNYNALEATCEMGVLHYLNTSQYKKANEIASIMDGNWQYFKSKKTDGKLLWYTHTNSILYWIVKDDKKLEHWTNRGLNIQRPNKGKMFFFGLRMLMLTYDYDNDQLLHFNEKVQALKKTMGNNEDLKSFEKTVLKYLIKLASIQNSNYSNNEKETLTHTLFKKFKTALLNLQQGKTDFLPPVNYEEILLWCESHLQKKTIKEVFEMSLVKSIE